MSMSPSGNIDPHSLGLPLVLQMSACWTMSDLNMATLLLQTAMGSSRVRRLGPLRLELGGPLAQLHHHATPSANESRGRLLLCILKHIGMGTFPKQERFLTGALASSRVSSPFVQGFQKLRTFLQFCELVCSNFLCQGAAHGPA